VGLEVRDAYTGEYVNLISQMFEYLPQAGNRFILPIGNWPLLGELIQEAYDNITLLESWGRWGFSREIEIELNWTAIVTVTYETEVGWLYDYSAALYNHEGDHVETITAGRIRNPLQDFFELANPILTPLIIIIVIIGCCTGSLGRFRVRYS
jgi:hypothetical protein